MRFLDPFQIFQRLRNKKNKSLLICGIQSIQQLIAGVCAVPLHGLKQFQTLCGKRYLPVAGVCLRNLRFQQALCHHAVDDSTGCLMRDAKVCFQINGGPVAAALKKEQCVCLLCGQTKPLEILIAVANDLIGKLQYFSRKDLFDFHMEGSLLK